MQLKRIAIDISKHVFTLHGVDQQEHPVLRRNLKRGEIESFFGKLPSTEVAMEACGGAHHWGRLLTRLGHTVRLIPAQYVKPFVKRAKNDRADAEAISDGLPPRHGRGRGQKRRTPGRPDHPAPP